MTVALEEANKILGKKIDVLCFDACLMQMVEVAYAAKDHVNYMVGSEETEPGKGAPYNDILKNVKKGITPKDFAINWVNAFGDSYNGGSQGKSTSTQSALEMSKFPQFVDAVNGFAKVGMAKDYSAMLGPLLEKNNHKTFPNNNPLPMLSLAMLGLLSEKNNFGTYLHNTSLPNLLLVILVLLSGKNNLRTYFHNTTIPMLLLVILVPL